MMMRVRRRRRRRRHRRHRRQRRKRRRRRRQRRKRRRRRRQGVMILHPPLTLCHYQDRLATCSAPKSRERRYMIYFPRLPA